MNFLKNKLLSVISASVLTVMVSSTAWAQSEADKLAVQEQAMELCQSAAEQRYGEGAIKKVSKKAKWSKGLNGAMVKMKIKPQKKKASKFQCVVSIDKSVKFYRG